MRLRKDLIAYKAGRRNDNTAGHHRRLCPACGKFEGLAEYSPGDILNTRDSRVAAWEDGRYITKFLWGCRDCGASWWHIYCEDDGLGIVGVRRVKTS